MSLMNFTTPDAFNRINLYLTSEWYFTLLVGLILSAPTAEYIFSKIKNIQYKKVIEAVFIIGLFVLSISDLANTSYNPFIYFRF